MPDFSIFGFKPSMPPGYPAPEPARPEKDWGKYLSVADVRRCQFAKWEIVHGLLNEDELRA